MNSLLFILKPESNIETEFLKIKIGFHTIFLLPVIVFFLNALREISMDDNFKTANFPFLF